MHWALNTWEGIIVIAHSLSKGKKFDMLDGDARNLHAGKFAKDPPEKHIHQYHTAWVFQGASSLVEKITLILKLTLLFGSQLCENTQAVQNWNKVQDKIHGNVIQRTSDISRHL